MFETRIQNTKLAGSLADCMFRRINGCDYEGDVSFISTLRALLMSRVTGENKIDFKVYNTALTDDAQAMTSSMNHFVNPNTIVYLNVTRDMTADDETIKRTFFAFAAPENLHEFMDVREFFAQKMACRAFICEENHFAMIAVLDSNIKKHHLAQCILPKLLPWYFAENRISVKEKNLLYSLRERYPRSYNDAIESFCDTDEFRQRSTSAALMVFKKKSLERQKKSVEQNIASHNATVDRLNLDLLAELRMINQENLKLNGILLALESETDEHEELAQFMANSRGVRFIESNNDDMTIVVSGHLDVYDPEAYRSMARNPNCWYWTESATRTGPFMTRLNRKLVMDAIFGDNPVFKIKTYGIYGLNLDNGSVSVGNTRTSHTIEETQNRYANPHLYYAGCLGSYRSHINRALQRGDIVGAISQCISSAHSVNVTESATFRHLCQDIFRDDRAILEGPNGQSFTTLQAYEYLRAQQNNETEGE